MALLALCLFPMIRLHARMLAQEKKELHYLQLTQLSQEAFCLLKEKLFEQRFLTYTMLKKGYVDVLPETFSLWINPKQTKQLSCSYQITLLDHVTKQQPREGYVCEVILKFATFAHEWKRILYLEAIG